MISPIRIDQPPRLIGDGTSKTFVDHVNSWQKVQPRFRLPTKYNRQIYWASHDGPNHPSASQTRLYNLFLSQVVAGELLGPDGRSAWTALNNQAYSRLVGRLQSADRKRGSDSAQAELGTTLLEYGKTRDWVAQSAEAVLDYTEQIKLNSSDRRIAEARRRVLESRRKKRKVAQRPLTKAQQRFLIQQRWQVPRWLGSRWLEYWMVVAPTIGDIHTGLQVLTRDVHLGEIYASAKTKGPYRYYSDTLYQTIDETLMVEAALRMGVTLVCRSPNLALAQSLGLLNPLVMAGELLPWTWFLGWFVNWKQVLNSWTDFAGYDVSNQYTTCFTRVSGKRYYYSKMSHSATYTEHFGVAVNRRLGLTLPKLTVTMPGKLSWQRATTSISLIVNLLTSR